MNRRNVIEKKIPPVLDQVDFSKLAESDTVLESRRAHLLQFDLAPYIHDDAYLIRRMGSTSRLLRRAPKLRPQIHEAFLANDDDSIIQLVDDLDLAHQTYSRENEEPINTILSFMTVLEDINIIRGELDVENDTQPRINAIFDLLYRKISYTFSEEQLDDAQISVQFLWGRVQRLYEKLFTQVTGRVYQEEEPVPQRLGGLNNTRIRLGNLFSAIEARNDNYKYIDGLPDDAGETVSSQEVEEQSRYISELFTAIRANQRYGVKMGYVSDDRLGGALLFGPVMQVGMFSNPEEISSTYHPLLDQTDAIATVVHTQRKHHQRIKVERHDAYGHTTAGFSDLGPSAALFLGGDGELYTWRDCKVSLRDIAVQKGKYKAYRDLQASVIAHYFDLTHRLDDVARIKRTLGEHPPQIAPEVPRALKSITRLVVPRVKWYTEETVNTAANLTEIAEEKSVRSVRRHSVTWHVKRLPEGWHPSPTALELAEKLGVTLGHNETIVKEHERGVLKLGQVTAHQFINRPGQK